ncbi:DUF6328 family protein [Parafrigoribacterium soli]|uniref:DUF6328 family protein n=1 Tax=Parafrigoribacterium soli TaxID=3144663 RepID=UPI0032F03A86
MAGDSDSKPNSEAESSDGREETPNERADRNWTELPQELRVTQTGTQIISGFLLTLAFQQRFTELQPYQVVIYLVLVLLAATSTALGLAPVGLHRTLFRHHEKTRMVAIGSRLLVATLWVVSVLAAGVVLFIFDVVLTLWAGIIAGLVIGAILVVTLIVLPESARRTPSRG